MESKITTPICDHECYYFPPKLTIAEPCSKCQKIVDDQNCINDSIHDFTYVLPSPNTPSSTQGECLKCKMPVFETECLGNCQHECYIFSRESKPPKGQCLKCDNFVRESECLGNSKHK